MKAPNKTTTIQNADWSRSRRSIVIDFEGGGRKPDGTTPRPLLLGARVPSLTDRSDEYRVWLLDPSLEPMARATSLPGTRTVATMEEAVIEVLELAEARDATVVAFSSHELLIVHEHCSKVVAEQLRGRFENVKLLAERVANKRGLSGGKTLNELLARLKPSFKIAPPPACKPAVACQRLLRAGARSKRWSKWRDVDQRLACELLAYNKGDCDGAYALLRSAVWDIAGEVIEE